MKLSAEKIMSSVPLKLYLQHKKGAYLKLNKLVSLPVPYQPLFRQNPDGFRLLSSQVKVRG